MSGETGVTIAATYVAPDKFSIAGDRVDEAFSGLRWRCDMGVAGSVTVTGVSAAFTGGVTVVTTFEPVLATTLAYVGHTAMPAGSTLSHAGQHAAGARDALDPESIGAVPQSALGVTVPTLVDGLVPTSQLPAGSGGDVTAVAEDLAAHEAASNPHSGSASTAALAVLDAAFVDHSGRHATGGADELTPAAIGAATAQALADEAAVRLAGDTAATEAMALLTPMTRMLNATFPLRVASQAGATLEADRTFSLVAAVLSELQSYGVTLTGKVVTDAVLAAATKLLIAANTIIYVATTGSDTTGDGSSSAPFASIAKALSSIAGKLIASGVLVTIQVADGTYSISSTIVINHPDANKIQILGNMSAETSVAISAINTTAKTITVVGNYVSNADATKNIQAGDIIILSGSSTSGLNGSYRVSSVSYDGTNTTVTTQGALSSSTVGGGSVIIKPANRCVLNFSSSVSGFTISFSNLYLLAGVKIKSTGNTTGVGVYCFGCPLVVIKYAVVDGFNNGVHGYPNTGIELDYCAIIGQNSYGILSAIGTNIGCVGTFIGDTTSYPMMATQGAFIRFLSGGLANNGGSNIPSPAFNASGNANSYISNT